MCKDCNKKRDTGVNEPEVHNSEFDGLSYSQMVQKLLDLERMHEIQCEVIRKLRMQLMAEEKDSQYHMATIQDLEEGIQAMVYHIKQLNGAIVDAEPDMNTMANAEAISLTMRSVEKTLKNWNEYFEMEGVEIPF